MNRIPLAERMRPQSLTEVIGQDEIIGDGKILTEIVKNGEPVNVIFWGPPGTGKTTLARILAHEFNADFIELSAVTAGKKDIGEVIERAKVNWNLKTRTILFVDEIHRFNKAQQDAFLPHVESGLITLIGATTENPSFEVISPLLSRSRVVILKSLSKDAIKRVIERAVKVMKIKIVKNDGVAVAEAKSTKARTAAKKAAPGKSAARKTETPTISAAAEGAEAAKTISAAAGDAEAAKTISAAAIDYLAELSQGDARSALGDLELAASLAPKITVAVVKESAGRKVPGYDKKGDAHYDNISAFIKSMRGSDVDATLYYLARMLAGGEDPKFIARRMVIFASEDIGLAASGDLMLAEACFEAVERVGLPEGEIILSHTACALAKAPKSRASYNAWIRAKTAAKNSMNLPIPLKIRNAPTKLMKDLGYGKDYKWEKGFHAEGSYLPDEIADQKFFTGE